ncbi:MAG: sensor histidine kinase [Ferruginibacter sp.]
MPQFSIQRRFLKDNSYLLLISLLLLFVSIFTGNAPSAEKQTKTYSYKIQKYIKQAEIDFNAVIVNDSILKNLTSNENNEAVNEYLPLKNQFVFVYKNVGGFIQLTYWSTQNVLPTSDVAIGNTDGTFKKFNNGYYFVQKKNIGDYIIVSLTPVKWQFNIASSYLENNFATAPAIGKNFEINFDRNSGAVFNKKGTYLFSLKNTNANKASNSLFTIWLRIFSIIPLLLFLHFTAVNLFQKQGFVYSVVFLATSLFALRLFSYVFFNILQLRQFELFDPSIYGSNIILQSLGDLLINALLFFWLISFIKNHLGGLIIKENNYSVLQKWTCLIVGAFVILFVTYTGSEIIRSMVADSQISFDVLNFFTLSVYSVIGFVVLCCLAIGYYYFCRTIFSLLQKVFPQFDLQFFLVVAIGGLFLLSFKIGNIKQGFELYELVWLLLFLFLIKNELSGFFSGSIIISRMVFWLFLFSASISTIIISENSRKELRNRQHYAELIAVKTNPINNLLLNTALTDFKPNLLADKFYLFRNEQTALQLKDSLIKNNSISFTDRYDIKVLVYDSTENPLFNEDPISYNSITGIISTQAKQTAVSGLMYYYSAYDQINYISKIVVRNYDNALLGYVFVVINPQIVGTQNLSPELFKRNDNNSIENSNEYAYAVYEKGKLISSHNDYAFSSRYQERYFAGREFLLDKKNKYSELWYNAGADKYVVVVKENRLLIELITLFSYLFCAFLLLTAVSWLVSLLVKSQLKIEVLKNKLELSIKQQVHGTIIFFSIFSFLIIGIATILFFINRYERNNKETLSRTIKNIEEELIASVPAGSFSNPTLNQDFITTEGDTENKVKSLAKNHGLDINIYSISGDLQTSSIPLPYVKGIVSTKMNPVAYFHLNKGKEIQYFQKEQIGKLEFISGYIPIVDSAGKDIAYLNIPYFISQSKIKEEISNFLITIINLNAFIFLIAGIVALIITNRITNSFSFISEKMKKINLGKTNEIMVWKRNDEIGALVKEYNKMLLKLEASAAALAKSERESAWQEMAKQVAHEIKNPLTPMKLSMQFLQKAIESGAPNIKELGARVSVTLIEQIDHLSQIAGEFSRFATIEKATPELFNINESLQSVKQLYEADRKTTFTWQLLQQDVFLYADKTHVNRILTNLILNGIQAVEEGATPNIIVEQTIQNKTLQIKITDNGTGISEQIQSRIFMPNFTTKSSGTGLGLAMCKRMAEQAGGDIRYETSKNGTSFYISFPIADV